MSSSIVRGGLVYLDVQPRPPGPRMNLSCYVTAFEITPSTEDIDVGTYCAPAITAQGRTTYTAILALLWEPALYDLLVPNVGKALKFYANPQGAAGEATQYITFDTQYAAMPWGRFEIGQRVEVELPLAVLSIPTMVTGAIPA